MTNWRSIGNVSRDIWARTLKDTGSPLHAMAEEAYVAAEPHTALCLAMLRVESRFGTAFNANSEANKNYLNLRPPDGDGFMSFASAVEGLAEWRGRITSLTYKNGIYAHTTTIAELIHIYAPSSDGNNEQQYVRSIETDLQNWQIELEPEEETIMAKFKVVGLDTEIEVPVPLMHDVISLNQPNQRPGIKRALPGFWVQHETGNSNPGADAEMHKNYLHNGALNDKGVSQRLSFHFAVDDGAIYQMIPIDEVTWQAADGDGPGNMSGISCELCINTGIDTAKARHNAEALCAGILKALGMGQASVKRHWDFNECSADRHHCPDQMMNDNYWPAFVANVGTLLGATPAETFAAPSAIPWKRGEVGTFDLHNTPALAFLMEVKILVDGLVPPVSATVKKAVAPKINKDQPLVAIGSYRGGPNRDPFVILENGGRVPHESVAPAVPLPDSNGR